MIIQVLGTDCSKCRTLYELANKAVEETGVDALVEKVNDIQQIMAYNLVMLPGLVIDGYLKAAGRVPSLDEMKKLILSARAA
jgi:small redox-active disulfide protein 2